MPQSKLPRLQRKRGGEVSDEELKAKYAFHIKGCRDAMIDAGKVYIESVLLRDAERLVVLALAAEALAYSAKKAIGDLKPPKAATGRKEG